MDSKVWVEATVQLAYNYVSEDDPPLLAGTRSVSLPLHTSELFLAIYPDADEVTVDAVKSIGRPQVQLSGTAAALEDFGVFLIALARLDSGDRDPHVHIEDVAYHHGGTAHLIVRRRAHENR